jgi:hypothetical protein
MSSKEIKAHGVLSARQIKAHENEIMEVVENHYGYTSHYYIRFNVGSTPHNISRGQPYLAWNLPKNLHTRIMEQ